MSPFVRRMFFWVLVVTFLVTTPAIILYFIGYRYSFDQGIFIYTGSVTIQANPTQNLAIRIDGKSVSSETNQINRSYHVEGIRPGKPLLLVSAPGFTTWSKEITVRSGISTEFWSVLLAREQYAQTPQSVPEGSVAFFPSTDGNKIALLSKQNNETLVTILDTTDGSRRQVFSTSDLSPTANNPESALQWSLRNNTLLLATLQSKTDGEEHTFIIHTDTLITTDIKDIVSVPHPKGVRWDPTADSVFFLSGSSLFETPIDTPLQEISLSENIESYDVVGRVILSLEPKTGILYRFSVGSPDQKKQLTTAPPKEFPVDYTTPFSLTAYDETRIAIRNAGTGDLFLFNNGDNGESFKKLSSDARGAQFSDDGKKLLFWSDWEISAIFTRKWETQPVREEGERLDVGRFESAIHSVQWEKDYEHILFSSEKNIRTIELDDRGGRNMIDILTLPASPVQVSSLGKQNKIFFLHTKGEGDTSSSVLSSITFPEPLGLFGFGG